MFLHRCAVERRASLVRAGRTSVSAGGTTLNLERSASAVSGDILVMSGDGGVILGRNPFPGQLVGRTIAFKPADAAATAYTVEVTDEGYRTDALGGEAVNLMSSASGPPIGDEDSREFDLPFPFPFYGETHTKLHVNSNGHITFGEADTSYLMADYAGFLSGPPKIAGASMDLDPGDSPGIASLQVYLTPTEAIISYVLVSSWFAPTNQVDFQIRLLPSGEIGIIHRRGPREEFVTGITPGGNRDVGRLIQYVNPPSGEITTSIAEVFTDFNIGTVDVFRASQVFFETQPDDYDYLVFFNDANIPAAPTALAYEITVRNEVEGTGDLVVDRSSWFGSTGRMQAVLNLGPLSQYPEDPQAPLVNVGIPDLTALSTLAHEAGHRFLAMPRLREGGSNTTSLLGRQLAHWSFNFNSHSSFMEGSDLSQNPDNPSSFVTGKPYQRFSELDHYLMGLIPAEDVGIGHRLFYVSRPATGARAPQEGVEITGARRDFSIGDIIAANGVRVPDYSISQKRFRFAFILVTSNMENAAASVAKLDRIRREFTEYFETHTLGMAIADTALKPALELDVFPAAGVLAGSEGSITVSRRMAGAAEVPLSLEAEGGLLSLPEAATIPGQENGVTVAFSTLATGIAKLRASSTDDSYLPAEASIVVEDAENLTLELVSASRIGAPPNTEVSDPIVVKVVNPQRLGFQGVAVRFEPITGGSVSPGVATTDARGEVSFRWTVGDESTNLARVYIDGARERTELIVTALADLNPDLRAATNAASFEIGVSPGSLATLWGVSLAAGKTGQAVALPLPTELEGVSVSINGSDVSLIYVDDNQINLYVPPNVTGDIAKIQVTTPDGVSNEFEAALETWHPGVFFDVGTNLGAILRANTGQKTDVLPAVPGGFVEIYATGLGPVAPAGRGVYRTQSEVTVHLVGQALEASFSGLAPGFSGLYQVNVQVPASLEPGTYELELEVEGRKSNKVNIIVGPPLSGE